MGLDRVKLMNYTKGEEIVNTVTHSFGALFGVLVLFLCYLKAELIGSSFMLVSAVVYGASMILLYLASSAYHAAPYGRVKQALRLLDHAMIYLLIAGSATPFALVSVYNLNPTVAWVILAIAWGGCLVGVFAILFGFETTKLLQMALYIGLGWLMLLAALPLLPQFPKKGLFLLLLGGGAYIIGSIFLGLGKKVKYMHSLFHLFVLAGSAIHFLCVFLYVLA